MPTPRLIPFLCPAFLLLALIAAARADITLPSLISDNMVLQQNTKINVWGKADPGESVTVQLGEQSAQTIAAKDGAWGLKLPGFKSGGPYEMTVSGKNSISIHNVAMGDVWLCAGESNMEYKVIAARNATEEMAEADYPMIRVFIVKHAGAESPASDCQGSWVVCDPNTVKDFSAAGYFFAREINKKMRVPIGLLQATWGPSPIEAWMPLPALKADPALRPALDHYAASVTAYPTLLAAYQARQRPVPPLAPGPPREPASLFNGMIAPLLRYPIRGTLWYQGESNVSNPTLYAKLFPALISSWRTLWSTSPSADQPPAPSKTAHNSPASPRAFPFFWAQLSGFGSPLPSPSSSLWAEMREAQSMALKAPKTGMAVTADIGEEHELHPSNKQDVGHRLALLAESESYGVSQVVALGPIFTGMAIDGAEVTLSFTNTGSGLLASNGSLKGFAIAGEDGKFFRADATIRGNSVLVKSSETPNPKAVRYGWADFPTCDLFNKERLPAAPFRTDQ